MKNFKIDKIDKILKVFFSFITVILLIEFSNIVLASNSLIVELKVDYKIFIVSLSIVAIVAIIRLHDNSRLIVYRIQEHQFDWKFCCSFELDIFILYILKDLKEELQFRLY